MTNRRMKAKTTDDLIEYVFQNFRAHDGEKRAFFEIPQVGALPVRSTYVAYICTGEDKAQLIDWMLDIFIELKRLGGVDWYWRLEEMITMQENKYRGGWVIRTRIAVLDKDLIEIRLPNEQHVAGTAPKPIYGSLEEVGKRCNQ